MRYIDRSRIDCGHSCPFKRYLAYDAIQGGRVPRSPNEHLIFGKALHAALDLALSDQPTLTALSETIDIEGTTPDGHPRSAEYYALGRGLLHAAETRLLPALRARYDVLGTEIEVTLPLSSDITYMTRLDAAVRRRKDGVPFVIEWKTSSFMDRLAFQHERQLQLMMEAECLRHHLGEWVGGVILIGFDKGRMLEVTKAEKAKGLSGKRRISPFTYYYAPPSTGWGDSFTALHEWKYGYDRCPVWVEPSDITHYLNYAEEHYPEVFDDCILDLSATPMAYDPTTIERLRLEIVEEERAFSQYAHIPRNYNNCHNDDGFMNQVCEYDPVCHADERIDGDLYTARTPNHPAEVLR
jgi:hypothetical protein